MKGTNMETIRLHPDCISCLLNKQLQNCPKDTPLSVRIEYIQEVLALVASAAKSTSAPVLLNGIEAIQKRMFGASKDYTEVKWHFNEVMLAREAELQEKVNEAADPLKLAIQYAMTGNYIDFGAMEHVDEEKLAALFEAAGDVAVDEDELAALKDELGHAEKIVYLTDNCGEIVMDKILMREIIRRNPKAELSVIVRGFNALNDATMEDAVQVGVTEMASVAGNGSDIAGTSLEHISNDAKQLIEEADLILAKGQGNFETMRNCGMNVYYIFMCKCRLFADRFNVPLYHGILVNDRHC